jgi:hypothetical protein
MHKAYCLFELSGCICVACLNYQVSVELLYHKLPGFRYQVSTTNHQVSGLTSTSLSQPYTSFSSTITSTTNHTTICYTNFSSTSTIQPSVRQAADASAAAASPTAGGLFFFSSRGLGSRQVRLRASRKDPASEHAPPRRGCREREVGSDGS